MKLIDAKKDQYRKLAHEQGFRSRASYKLKEINKSYRIIGPGSYVLDLGCAPGGWTQVAKKISGNQGKVLGIDLSFVEEIPNAKIIHLTRDYRDHYLSMSKIDFEGNQLVLQGIEELVFRINNIMIPIN